MYPSGTPPQRPGRRRRRDHGPAAPAAARRGTGHRARGAGAHHHPRPPRRPPPHRRNPPSRTRLAPTSGPTPDYRSHGEGAEPRSPTSALSTATRWSLAPGLAPKRRRRDRLGRARTGDLARSIAQAGCARFGVIRVIWVTRTRPKLSALHTLPAGHRWHPASPLGASLGTRHSDGAIASSPGRQVHAVAGASGAIVIP
jgi:hypothetical protein